MTFTSETGIQRVAVLGGTGYLGKFVVAELAAEGFNVVVFSRSKEENVPSGVEVREVEEDVAGLASKLQDVDAVVSALAFPLGAAAQSTALRAAKQAGSVKRFVLSEFGTDYTDIPSPNPFDAKKAAIKLATELGIEWAGIPTGLIIENFASGRSAVDGIKGTAIVVGTGDEKFGYTSLKDIARAVAGSLKRKEGKGWLPIQGGEITDKEVIALFEKESGKKFQVTNVPLEGAKQSLGKQFDFGVYLGVLKAEGKLAIKGSKLAELSDEKPFTVADFAKATKGGTELGGDWYSKL